MSKYDYVPACSSDISKKVWKDFSLLQQELFNAVYEEIVENQDIFLHPKDTMRDKKLWKTVAHNAAWVAMQNLGVVLHAWKEKKII